MNISIEQIKPKELSDDIRDLVRVGLGDTYAENIKSVTKENNVLLVAKSDGKPVGFACGYDGEDPTEYLSMDVDVEANSLLEKNAVHPDFRGEGIGTLLTEERLKRLEQSTIAESWMRTGSPDSTIILEKLGFKLVRKEEDRWYDESIEAGDPNFCPDCGKVCYCDCAVYILDEYEEN